MTNEAFWGLTLRRFALLGERYREARKRADRRAGEVVAILFNVNRSEKAEALDWEDFFPEWKEETPEQTEEQMLENMKLWTATTKGLPS